MQAFEAIHGLHVVHSDIRADNVLVADDGRVWVVDFEFARIIDNEHTSEFSAEMGNVKEMLKVTKLEDRRHAGCLQLPVIGAVGLESSVQVH